MAQRNSLDLDRIDAFIFDMDGIVTDTAAIHAQAWKRLFDEYLRTRSKKLGEIFRPFDISKDYRRYVDGRPRYDGVRTFLEARGISLPYGQPDDGPDKETICGLGNRKNGYFLEHIRTSGIEPLQPNVDFVRSIRSKGLRTAVISSSRNCVEVLQSAGVRALFDVKVDGNDSEELQLNGKPAPDIFLEAARQLKVQPSRAAVVEDAVAGVEAGREGEFGLVIGVGDTRRSKGLKKHGAHLVVNDLSELDIHDRRRQSPRSAVSKKLVDALPSALSSTEEIYHRLRQGTPSIFLDYDGTLTKIVDDPARALLSRETRRIIKRLMEYYTVAVISGRDLKDVRNLVDVQGIVYAGSHGFDIAGLHNQQRQYVKKWERYLGPLDSAESELRSALGQIPGILVERKKYALTVHYRGVETKRVKEIENRLDKIASKKPALRKAGGKKIFELLPAIDWNKGKALLWLLETLYVDGGRITPLYIGDDVTDEDAFKAIQDFGVGIVVGQGKRKTAAHYSLRNSEEVKTFLQALVVLAEKHVPRGFWVFGYDGFSPDEEKLREALCTVGNGYFATRGAAPESEADENHYPGTYVAGCYNRLKTRIAGQVIENESLVNLPNWLALTFRQGEGDWFQLSAFEILEYRQELDLQRGVLNRFLRFRDKAGRITRVAQRRFVSMADQHLAGLQTTIVPENWSGTLTVRSALDGHVANTGVERYRPLNHDHLAHIDARETAKNIVLLQVETNQSHIRVAEAARTRVYRKDEPEAIVPANILEPFYAAQEYTLDVYRDEPVKVDKVVALVTSKDDAISESALQANKEVSRAPAFDELLERHIVSWDHLWHRCRLSIETNNRAVLILNLHIFHLLQTVSTETIALDVGVPPRGLHGEAYRGHIMWDELFVFPFLNLRIPDITRSLLMYRYRRLPEARWAAAQAGYRGAMYPWQSGSDGREESQELHLNPMSGRWIPDNSQLQRHINIAIAYNVWLFYQVTRDVHFMEFYGAEMMIEIARFLASLAEYNHSLDRYEIKKVMGPDEYHDRYPDADEPGIDNNAYTNVMAVWLLCRAREAFDLLPEDRRTALREDLGLTRQELQHWDDISHKMRLVFSADGIISQFEGYDKLQEFDWEAYRQKYHKIERLDRILEAEGDSPNRYKVSKQADVLMLFYLLSSDELKELFERLGYSFDPDMIPRNIDYYLRRTSHGSTLSRIVHSWVLARSKRELSWHLFREALHSDVEDIQGGTTPEGIHLGAMAGTVDLVQRCYTGIETRGDVLRFNPYLPDDLKEISFAILYRQHLLSVSITRRRLKLSTRPFAAVPIKVGLRDQVFEMGPGETREFDLERE